MMDNSKFEIKGAEESELLTTPPHWVIQWGGTIIFSLLLITLTFSIFIKYPDVLNAKVLLTNTNPPVTIVSKTSGRIVRLNFVNNAKVKEGDILLVIENSAQYKDVILLENFLIKIHENFKLSIDPKFCYDSLQLGELTPYFVAFMKSYNDFQLHLIVAPQRKEIDIINTQLKEYLELQDRYTEQELIFKEEFSLVEKDFNRIKILFQNQSISAKEMEDKNREFLASKRTYEGLKTAYIKNALTINDLEKSKLQLQVLDYQEDSRLEQEVIQSFKTLSSEIENWKQRYLLIAPIDGTVSLFDYWSVNQNIKQGEEILSIIPMARPVIIAKLEIPVFNSGKLRKGQVVNLKLNNYPYQEFGILKGLVADISEVPHKEKYSIKVALPNQLKTTYGKTIDYRQEMQGIGEIITEERSFFERIFDRFSSVLNR